jgi:hypothetical protein
MQIQRVAARAHPFHLQKIFEVDCEVLKFEIILNILLKLTIIFHKKHQGVTYFSKFLVLECHILPASSVGLRLF